MSPVALSLGLWERWGLQGIIHGKPVRTTISDKMPPYPLDRVNSQFRAPRPNMRPSDLSDSIYAATWRWRSAAHKPNSKKDHFSGDRSNFFSRASTSQKGRPTNAVKNEWSSIRSQVTGATFDFARSGGGRSGEDECPLGAVCDI